MQSVWAVRVMTQQDTDLTLTGMVGSAEMRDMAPSQVDHVAPRTSGDELGATHSQLPQAPQEKQAELPELPPMPPGLVMQDLVPTAVLGVMPHINSSLDYLWMLLINLRTMYNMRLL